MKQNNYGEMIFNEDDICDLLMRGRDVTTLNNMIVDESVNIENAIQLLENFPTWIPHTFVEGKEQSVVDWDHANQQNWKMPQEYKDMDIASYILGLCSNEAELQRCGEELLLYQERDLFELLKYLKYLVDIMKANNVIWGVGRGSSVASFILYKMGVHRLDCIFYKLNINEFLR